MAQLQNQLLQVTKTIEKQVDAAIEQIDNLNVNDLEEIRKSRVNELRKLEAKRTEWLQNGHGTYDELADEKEFFNTIKKSQNCIVHFYRNASERCRIVDKHLKLLAPKHMEARVVKINAEKSPFLAEKLKIKTLPTIVLVKNNVMVDKIVGFTQLGNCDDFTTEMLEWRIGHSEVIDYEGDLSVPPHLQEKKFEKSYKRIRDSAYNREDDDLDIEEEVVLKTSLDDVKTKLQSTELTAEEAAELGLDE